MEFHNPEYFFLLLLIVPYVVWHLLFGKKSRPSMRLPEVAKYRYVPRTLRTLLMPVPLCLRVICFTLVVCVLARPQTKNDWTDTDVEGIDIMLSVDISTSMLAQDFKPNRVEALREIASQFIDKRPNDNIGLTFFAGEAYTQCPLTPDHTVLTTLYNSDNVQAAARGIIADGTAIGDGIMNSLLRLKESKAKSKVIILLTDGVSNMGNISPLTAAEIAKQYKVRIYTIGVGKTGMADYPLPTGGTAKMPVEIDEPLMRKISAETDGQYFRAQNNTDLSAIYSDIDKMERTKFSVHQVSKRTERYEPFALAAFATLLLEILLSTFVLKRIP